MCDNKAVALACYQTCEDDQNSLTESQINEACNIIVSSSVVLESIISQLMASTDSAESFET